MKNFHSYLLRSVFRVALLGLIFSLPVGLAAAAEAPPDWLATWGSVGSGDGQFSSPYGVAVDSAGNVYVADSYNHRIQKFDAGGTFVTKWGSYGSGDGQFVGPWDVAVDSAGNFYVVDTGNHRIQKFDAGGAFQAKWGGYGSGDGQFISPRGMAVDSAGSVYVADSYNHRIQKFDAGGTFVTKWGSYGSGDGQFSYPFGVAVDSAGSVYVADSYNHRIQKFDAGGTFVAKWGSYGSGDGQSSYPFGVAVDSAGNVYVADTFKDRIQKFDAGGTFLAQWGSYGSGDGQFFSPFDVAADDVGNVYVADTDNDRIQKFGNPSLDVEVEVDIRPGSCRNPLNMRSRGVLPVAILGSGVFDVRDIDVATITLSLEGAEGGAAPIRSTYADVSGPLEGEVCDWHELGPDGYEDLALKFKTQEVAGAIRALGEVNHRDVVVLTIRGTLEDGTHFAGEDSVTIIKRRHKKHWKWGKCKKGKK